MTAGLVRLTEAAVSSPAGTGRASRPVSSHALTSRFPPRPGATTWPQTRLDRSRLLPQLHTAPFVADTKSGEENRRRGLRFVLDWLQAQRGDTWQQRWLASGAGKDGRTDWRSLPIRWRKATTGFDRRHPGLVATLIMIDTLKPVGRGRCPRPRCGHESSAPA